MRRPDFMPLLLKALLLAATIAMAVFAIAPVWRAG